MDFRISFHIIVILKSVSFSQYTALSFHLRLVINLIIVGQKKTLLARYAFTNVFDLYRYIKFDVPLWYYTPESSAIFHQIKGKKNAPPHKGKVTTI